MRGYIRELLICKKKKLDKGKLTKNRGLIMREKKIEETKRKKQDDLKVREKRI